jgi:hypothetical protein
MPGHPRTTGVIRRTPMSMGDIRFLVMAALFGGSGIFIAFRPDLAKDPRSEHPISRSPFWLIRIFGVALMAAAWAFRS